MVVVLLEPVLAVVGELPTGARSNSTESTAAERTTAAQGVIGGLQVGRRVE
jgi:hypothetical protein